MYTIVNFPSCLKNKEGKEKKIEKLKKRDAQWTQFLSLGLDTALVMPGSKELKGNGKQI